MASYADTLLKTFFFLNALKSILCNSIDLENIPGVSYDFRIHVDAGREECFYQYVYPGAKIFTSYQVLRGGDGMAGFAVRHPNGVHVHPYQWKAESEYQEISNGGIYEICIDNQFSRFASKLVSVFIVTYKHEEWEAFTKELEDLDISVTNFTHTLSNVSSSVDVMVQIVRSTRQNEHRDLLLLQANNAYVQWWSVLSIGVIVATSTVQVFFVKKLFESSSSTGSRARC